MIRLLSAVLVGISTGIVAAVVTAAVDFAIIAVKLRAIRPKKGEGGLGAASQKLHAPLAFVVAAVAGFLFQLLR